MTAEIQTLTAGFKGSQGIAIVIEATTRKGPPSLNIIGIHDEHAVETRDRVHAAIANSGMSLRSHATDIWIRREPTWQCTTAADLAIAVAITGVDQPHALKDVMFIGELGLDGSVRPVRGIVALIQAAVDTGVQAVVVPEGNLAELAETFGLVVYGVSDLEQAVAFRTRAHVHSPSTLEFSASMAWIAESLPSAAVSDVLMVAAAGSHHVALSGGDELMRYVSAALLSELLPNLDDAAATETAAHHSLAGIPRSADEWWQPPFVALQPSSPLATIVGGGRQVVQPGAVTLAHHGLLLATDSGSLSRHAVNALTACIDDGQVALARASGTVYLPTRFQLLLAHEQKQRNITQLLDRCAVRATLSGGTSKVLDDRSATRQAFTVLALRSRQARMAAGERWDEFGITANANVPEHLLARRPWRLPTAIVRNLNALRDLGSISSRGYTQVLQVAWTLADIGGRESPSLDDVHAAIELRGGAIA